MAFLKKIGTLFGRGKKPQKPSTLAPKHGTSQEPEREHIENRLREIRAKWLQFEEQARKGIEAEWRKARGEIAETQPRFTMPPPEPEAETVDNAQWYDVISSNVERIRYGNDDQKLQVVFKDGSLYQYEDVPPEIFMEGLRTHSPGQWVWYTLRAYGFAYAKLSTGHATTAPRADRFSGEPYAVPEEVQEAAARAGRGAVDRVPVAKGFAPPPGAFAPSKQPR